VGSTHSTHGEKCLRGLVGELREGDHLKEMVWKGGRY